MKIKSNDSSNSVFKPMLTSHDLKTLLEESADLIFIKHIPYYYF